MQPAGGSKERTANARAQTARRWRLGSIALLVCCGLLGGELSLSRALAQTIDLPEQAAKSPIQVSALRGERWREGAYDVWYLAGGISIRQGELDARGSEAIVWVENGDPYLGVPTQVLVYLEGAVDIRFDNSQEAIDAGTGRYTAANWYGRFRSTVAVEMNVVPTARDPNENKPILDRAREAMQRQVDGKVALAQFPAGIQDPFRTTPPTTTPSLPSSPAGPGTSLPTAPPSSLPTPPAAGLGVPGSSPIAAPESQEANVQFTGRNGGRPNIQSFQPPDRNEQIWVFDKGIRITLRSPVFSELNGSFAGIDQVVLMADRGVAWTSTLSELISTPGGNLAGQRWEFYLEGNIVFAAGDRVVYADRLYYDANFKRGTIFGAEILSPVDGYDGLLRLKADIVQQLDERSFRAFDAAVTSSRLGFPSYWVQTDSVEMTHNQTPRIDPFTGNREIDPNTGMPLTRHEYLTESNNNFVYVGGVPVFYWPTLTNDLAQPTYYLEQLSIKSDAVFGTQVLTDWDLYQLLGWRNRPQGTDWNLTFDVLSERGIGVGSEFTWDRRDLFGLSGPYSGFIDSWGIKDDGLDNLGQDRRAVPLEEEYRGRVLGRHRHRLDSGWQVTAEAGWISDRNFLEQYYENEWDTQKDLTTGVEVLRNGGNRQFSVEADGRLNDFFTQTQWLPKVQYSIIGQPLLGDALVWSGRTTAGYAELKTAVPPTNPVDAAKWDPLAWEQEVATPRIGTRHSLEFPFQLGAVKVTFYGMGDATYYGEDLTGDDLTRLYGQTGVRTSLPLSRVDPMVRSELFNLSGLAHKISFDTDLYYADATANLDQMPLLDPLDDDSQEAFRRRFFFDTFGGVPGGDVPLRFDERNFAFRSNLQGNVTSPTWDLADDVTGLRMGVSQRWQTKRGAPGEQRIIDWIVLDVGGTWFPKADENNFGESFGLLDAKFRWHVGDRFTILSDGYADLFGEGLRTISLGTQLGRPEQGNLYVGFRSIEGPITANILSSSLSYRMSEKWIATAGASVDFGPTGNIGQSIAFTRIGESFLMKFGLRADASRGNVGAIFSIEPRFLARSRSSTVGGVYVPPPGSRGLE